MPHTFINCLLGQWGRVQHIWYQGSKSCLIKFAGAVSKMHCPALVNQSRAGQGTLVLISNNIIHETKAAALVTKTYSNQDRETISLLSTVGQISCNVQSLADTLHLPRDMCHVTCDMWHMTCDMWPVICDTWHVTCDTWQFGEGEHSLNISAP